MKTFSLSALVTINPFSGCASGGFFGGVTTPASAVWNTANRAYFAPFRLSRPFEVTQMGLLTGATASGNVDVGIYDASGKQLVVSGATAQSASTNVQQIFPVKPTLLGPGLFYLAAAMDNITGTVFRSSANGWQAAGAVSMNTAFPLPVTATFAVLAATFMPMVSATGRSVL